MSEFFLQLFGVLQDVHTWRQSTKYKVQGTKNAWVEKYQSSCHLSKICFTLIYETVLRLSFTSSVQFY